MPTNPNTITGLAVATHRTALDTAQAAKTAARTYLSAMDLMLATAPSASEEFSQLMLRQRAVAQKAADAATDLHDMLSNL